MSLLVAFDDINARGNNLLLDYLSGEFPTILLEPGDTIGQIKANPGGKCLFTTSVSIAQEANSHIKTVLYINDPFEGQSTRGNNISSWRQNVAAFKNLEGVFVASSALATTFLNTYRIPCRMQYPYVPKKEKGSPTFIVYNKVPSHINKMMSFAPHESYMEFQHEEDFKAAKLYIHTPEPGEQWSINIPLAHAYGVPCITYQQGSFSEFCTSGDKILPCGADERTWMGGFKLALRDHAINSKIVYDMSQRFYAMNEIQQKIKKALSDNGFKKTPPTFSEINKTALDAAASRLQSRSPKLDAKPPVFKQKIVRPLIKSDDYLQLVGFVNHNPSVYGGVGGLGDALLTLAASHMDPGSKVVFGANSGVQQPIKQLFDTFEVEALVVRNFNGSVEGRAAWRSLLENPHCKGGVHIPADLNYGDWNNNAKGYLDKTVKRMPLVKILGKLVNSRATKKVIGLSPRGSDHTSQWKQRYLTRDEYQQLVKNLLKENATVMVFGSEDDLNYYGVYQDNNVIFMNSNFAISHPAPKYPISMRHMLTAVNSCDLIISVDTWLKTYAALAGIPCKVIMNRYFGKSTMDYADASDKIFLDTSAWGFEIVSLDSLF